MLDKSRKTETEVSPKDRKRPRLKSEIERRVGGQNKGGTDAQHVSMCLWRTTMQFAFSDVFIQSTEISISECVCVF